MLQGKYKVAESGLLRLLNERKAWDAPAFHQPEVNVARATLAAGCVAEVDNSNPWAGPRALLHMLGGLELPSEVLKECTSQRNIRRKQAAHSLELSAVKRKMDEDKAWNQFHAKQYVEAAE